MDGTELTDQDFKIAVLRLLVDIRDVLTQGVQAAETEETEGCSHPDEKRVSLATPTRPDHWMCAECRYEHRGLVHN